MLVLLLLLVYTACVVLYGPQLAAGRSWTSRMPRLGLLVCQAIPAAAFSGVLLMAAMTAVSVQHLRVDIGHLLHACAVAVWDSATHPSVPLTTALGLIAAALLTHLVRTAARTATSARRLRRQQREGLALMGAGCDKQGYTLVPSQERFAYCLPGAGGRIVVSTAAKRELADDELAAVLAHERAHLRERHHALLQITHVLAKAVPLRSVRALHAEAATLIEMVADDRACRESSAEALLTALLALGSSRAASPGLAMNGAATAARALRLATPVQDHPISQRLGVCAVAVALVVTPWVLGGVPVALALTGHCSV
jgi:Zn-dependent protease with chaperone function